MKKSKWMIRFWKNFTQKEFIPVKILFFLIYGGMNTLFPFLSIQARSLGISSDELGIIYSFLPVLGIIGPAFAGMFADKIGNFKIFMAVMVCLSGMSSLLFLAVPAGRIIHDMPEELPLTLNCSRFNKNLEVNSPLKCDFNNISNAEMRVKKCKYFCENEKAKTTTIATLNKTWCSVTENCETFDNSNIATKLSGYSNASFNNMMTIEVAIIKKEDDIELQMTSSPFSTEFWKATDDRESYLSNDITYVNKNSATCWLRCEVSSYSKTLCNNTQTTEDISPRTTMLAYIAVRLLNSFTLTCSIPLFEGAAIAVLKEYDGDFGYQRMFANLGMVVMTPISGFLIDVASSLNGRIDFRPAFYMYCGVKFLCAFVICFINLDFKKPSNTVLRDIKILMIQPRVFSFLAFTFVSGICFGFIDTFLFWFLEDMKADKSLMGLAVTAGAVFGIPLLFLSTYIIKRLGHVGTLCLAMGIYTIRNLGYSFIQNPWMAMPFEAMEAFTNSLMGVVSVSYTAVLSIPTTVVSLQGIYGGMYYGIGRGSGSLLGGFLVKHIGVRVTFQILAVVSAITSIVYFALNWFTFRRNELKTSKNRSNAKHKSKETDLSNVEKTTEDS